MPSIPSPTGTTSVSPSPSSPSKSDSQPSTARKEKVEKKTPIRKRDVPVVKEKKLTAKEKAAIAEAEAQAAREAEKEQARLEAERVQQQRLAGIAAQAALARERDPSSSTRGFQRLILSTTVTSYDGEMHNGLYHGKGRATFKMGQTYDGEWDAGLMHGYGKYTWADGSWYEGTLTASAITGRGIYHWIDGSTYDGDVEDGYRHGIGTFRDLSVPCIYEGAWSHGERHGMGRMIYDVDGKSWYYGEWVNNTRHGQGTITYASGNTYQGDWVRDRKTGHGTMTWHTTHESYTGTWVDDSPHGHGEYHWYHLPGIRAQQTPSGPITTVHFQIHNRYVGDMWRGERHGKGTFFYSSGAVYQGDWEHNRKHGHGRFVFENGSIYDGPFIDDRMSQDTWTTQDTRMLELPIDDILHKMCDDGTMGVDTDVANEWDDEVVMDDDTRAQRMSQIITTQKQLVTNLLLRYNSEILDVYRLYATLDLDTDVDAKDDESMLKSLRLDMNQIWQFAIDCRMMDGEMTRAQLDRLALHRLLHDENYEAVDFQQLSDLHSPSWILLVRQFAELLVRIAHHRFDADQVDVKTGKSVPVVIEEEDKQEKEEVVETPSPVVEVPVVVQTPAPAPVVETTIPEKKSRAGKRTSLKNTAATTTTEAPVTTPAPATSAATVAPTSTATGAAPVAATTPAVTAAPASAPAPSASIPSPAPNATVAPSASSSTLSVPTLTITSSTASLASTSSTAALAALNARHLQLRHLTLAERVKKLFDVHILPYAKNRARWGTRYDSSWLPPHRLTRVIATTHAYDQQLRDMFTSVATEQREIGVLSSRPLHDLTITVRSFLRILSTRDMFLADRSRFGPIHILRTLTSPPLDGHALTDIELYSNLEMEMIYAEFIESIVRVAIVRGEIMAKIEAEEEEAKRVAEEAQAAANAAEVGENAEATAASDETTKTTEDVLSPLTSPVTEPVVASSTPTSAPVSVPSPVLRPSINPNAPSTASMNLSSPSSTHNRSRGSVSTPSRPSVTRRPSQGRERADSTSRASETSRGTQRGNLRRPHKVRTTRLSLITAPDVLQFTGSPDDVPHLTDADRATREKDIMRWCAMVQQFVLQLVRGKETISTSKPISQAAAEEPSQQQPTQGEVQVV